MALGWIIICPTLVIYPILFFLRVFLRRNAVNMATLVNGETRSVSENENASKEEHSIKSQPII